MILKKVMSFDLAKQRTLGLLDSEFNHFNKMFQKFAMEAALDNNANLTNNTTALPERALTTL